METPSTQTPIQPSPTPNTVPPGTPAQPPQTPARNKNKMLFLVGGIVAALVLLGAGGYTVYTLGAKEAKPSPTPIPTVRVMPSPTPTVTAIAPTTASAAKPGTNDLLAGGSSYADANGVYTILYPSDFKLDTSDPLHPRIYKIGATQKGQTEMYDGVMVVFETVNLQGKTLSTWVDDHIKTSTADGTSKVVSPKKATALNTYPAFTYQMQGLGTATYYAVQKDASSKNAVLISTSVQDPKKVGFQKDVDKTLATLELLK